MHITEDELRRRLHSTSNLASPETPNADDDSAAAESTSELPFEVRTKGVPHRGPQVPEFLRDVMGTLSLDPSCHQGQLAQSFGVSDSVVSAAKTGRVGGKPPNLERKAKIEDRVQEVKDVALEKLMLSLGLISDDKLEDLSAKDLSGIASNMGKVFSSLTDKAPSAQNNLQLVFYSPELRKEDKFKEIEV